MKTKKASKTKQKSRIIFFAIVLIYNLLLGFYMKDFLVLSPILLTFYLLSSLPTLFLLFDVRSKSMRAIIFVTLFLILLMDLAYVLNCRRVILCIHQASYTQEGAPSLPLYELHRLHRLHQATRSLLRLRSHHRLSL